MNTHKTPHTGMGDCGTQYVQQVNTYVRIHIYTHLVCSATCTCSLLILIRYWFVKGAYKHTCSIAKGTYCVHWGTQGITNLHGSCNCIEDSDRLALFQMQEAIKEGLLQTINACFNPIKSLTTPHKSHKLAVYDVDTHRVSYS